MKTKMIAAILLGVALSAAHTDKRLAAVRKAFVVPADELGDDVGVATCLAEHLKASTPIEAVKAREEADVVFTVKAHLPSATTRFLVGTLGGTPSADLEAALPDGTKLWADGAKLRRAITGKAATTGDVGNPLSCGLADELLDTLRKAMREARDVR